MFGVDAGIILMWVFHVFNVGFNIIIFYRKNRYAHKAGFMRHKPPQELVQEAYAEGLCGWLMRGLVRSAYAEYKALCGPLMRTTAKFQN